MFRIDRIEGGKVGTFAILNFVRNRMTRELVAYLFGEPEAQAYPEIGPRPLSRLNYRKVVGL